MSTSKKISSIKTPRYIFLLGSKEEHAILKEWAQNDPNNRYHLNGWFHDKNIPASSRELIDEYEAMAQNDSVDHFVLDPTDMDPEMLQASIDWAESQGSRIHLIQSGTTPISRKIEKVNRFGPFAAVPLRREPLSLKSNQLLKKTFDLLLSILVMVGIMWWFYPIIGILIKQTGKGPVIIRQDRIGIDGIRFQCMKFRTILTFANQRLW